MEFDTSTILLGAISLLGAAGYIIATWKTVRPAAVLSKVVASTSFVALALINGAAGTVYGRAILTALIFSWIGDVLLLSRESSYLLAGITAFLVAHLAFAAAFATTRVSPTAFAIGLALTGILGWLTLRWLWKYLSQPYRLAIPLYLIAVMVMVSLAVAGSAMSMRPTVAVGALAFAVSDISVARDRFIERDVVNKAWGLPLYYLAQVLFATSVITRVG